MTAWHRHPFTVLLAIVLIPPVGLVLVWTQRNSRLPAKLVGSVAAVAFGLAHLFLFWGLRLDLDGSLGRPFLTFRNADRHYAEIEKRHEQDLSKDVSKIQAPVPEPQRTVPVPEKAAARPPAVTAHRAYWTEFRGPGRNGVYAEREIATSWPSGKPPLIWKRPVGGGYASAVVADGLVFTIEQRREREVVAAYDLGSGRERWIHGWEAAFRETMGGDGPRATPTWHEGRLYALGAAGELRCLDAKSGGRIWSRNILQDNGATNLTWGMAASPLIVDDKVIVLPGGPDGRSVVAYDQLTGEPIWKALDDKPAYTAPLIVSLAGRRQLLIVTATRVVGLVPEDGTLLWSYPWVTHEGINVAQPIVTDGNRFFISAGYSHGAALVEIVPKGEGYEARSVWQNNRMKNKFSSSVLCNGYIYGLDEAILACIDAATGDLKWKGGRYGYGQVLLASGHLVITTEDGDVVLVRAGPEKPEEVVRFPAVSGKTWNVPAIAEGRLIVRNSTEISCFRIGD